MAIISIAGYRHDPEPPVDDLEQISEAVTRILIKAPKLIAQCSKGNSVMAAANLCAMSHLVLGAAVDASYCSPDRAYFEPMAQFLDRGLKALMDAYKSDTCLERKRVKRYARNVNLRIQVFNTLVLYGPKAAERRVSQYSKMMKSHPNFGMDILG